VKFPRLPDVALAERIAGGWARGEEWHGGDGDGKILTGDTQAVSLA